MSERLPLSERSFRALEDAYEKQRSQAQHLHDRSTMSHTSETVGRFTDSAGAAAAEMQRLLTETRQLHQRFVHIAANSAPPFNADECRRLSLLGFDVSTLSPPSSAGVPSNGAATQSERAGEKVLTMPVPADGAELTALKLENEQLLASLAWYRFREGVAHALPSTTTVDGTSSFSSYLSSELLRNFSEVQECNTSLCSSLESCARVSLPPHTTASAVDVAIDELLQLHRFPPQVRIERIACTPLYHLDRPVSIVFASPNSSLLVVQDPEGAEEDSDLRTYLMNLYEPLLRALNWRLPSASSGEDVTAQESRLLDSGRASRLSPPEAPPAVARTPPTQKTMPSLSNHVRVHPSRPAQRSPSIPQSTLSQMTYAELVALKHATLQRLGRSADEAPL